MWFNQMQSVFDKILTIQTISSSKSLRWIEVVFAICWTKSGTICLNNDNRITNCFSIPGQSIFFGWHRIYFWINVWYENTYNHILCAADMWNANGTGQPMSICDEQQMLGKKLAETKYICRYAISVSLSKDEPINFEWKVPVHKYWLILNISPKKKTKASG